MKNVITIAGSDPSGGAGLQADIAVFRDLKVRPFSVVTALTAQSGAGVIEVRAVPASFVATQLETLIKRYEIDALKIGMLARASTVRRLVKFFKENPCANIVLDPVMDSSNGISLLDADGRVALMDLLPYVRVLTPNLDEAAALTNRRVRTIREMKEAAKRLHDSGPGAVVIKGGHLKKSAVDLLYDGLSFEYIEGERVTSAREWLHGTGCRFSSAISAHLASGVSLESAVRKAKLYVLNSIRRKV